MTLGVRLTDSRTDVVDLSDYVRQSIRQEAAFRRLSPEGLVAQLLEAIVAHDQFADVLDKGGKKP